MPPKPAMYLRLVPAEKVYQYLAGDEGPRRVNDIAGAGRPHEANAPNKRIHNIVEPYAVFKRNKVFLTRTYHIDRTGPIDLMTRVSSLSISYSHSHSLTLSHQVSSIGEFNTMVEDITDCEYIKGGYKSCIRSRRIYDEDNDTGHTIDLMYCIENCMLFNEDGAPIMPPMNRNAQDARDLSQVFFLRNVPDSTTGADVFMPIEYMGDIDKDFLSVNSAGNVGRSIAAVAFPNKDERSSFMDTIQKGLQLVHLWNGLPLPADLADITAGNIDDANMAGRTTWSALIQIANIPGNAPGDTGNTILEFVTAIREVARRLGGHTGNRRNIFLDPSNGLPTPQGGAQPEPATVLYENLLNHSAVPVFSVTDGANVAVAGDASGPLRDALAFLMAGFLDDTNNAQAAVIRGRNFTPTQTAALVVIRGRITLGGDLTGITPEIYAELRQLLLDNVPLTRANNAGDLRQWLDEIDRSYRSAAARQQDLLDRRPGGGQLGRVGRAGTLSILAVYPDNPDFTDGSAMDKGWVLASRFDLTQPGDGNPTVTFQGGVMQGPNTTIIGDFARLKDMPIFRGLHAAQQRNVNTGAGFDNVGRAATPVDDPFAPLTDYHADPVGAMAGMDVDAMQARRGWVPRAGGQIGMQPVELRFGTMAYNLEHMSKSATPGLAKLAAALLYGAPWHADTLMGFAQNNIPVPIGFLLWRNGMYDMALGIKCKRGKTTGRTYYGHSDFQLSDDAVLKVHYGNFTHYGEFLSLFTSLSL